MPGGRQRPGRWPGGTPPPPGSSRITIDVGAAQLGERRGDGLRPEHHAGAAAVRVVVDRPVLAEAPAPEVVDADRRQAALQDPGRDALAQRALDHRREQREDVDLEGHDGCRLARRRTSRPAGAAGGRRSSAAGRAAGRSPRPRPGRASRSSASRSTTISPRSGASSIDDPVHAGDVELAARPADDEHLGARRRDRARRSCPAPRPTRTGRPGPRARPIASGRARAARRACRSRGRRRAAPRRPSRSGTSRNRSHQPGPSATADASAMVRPRDEPSGYSTAPGDEAVLRAVGEELDADAGRAARAGRGRARR